MQFLLTVSINLSIIYNCFQDLKPCNVAVNVDCELKVISALTFMNNVKNFFFYISTYHLEKSHVVGPSVNVVVVA